MTGEGEQTLRQRRTAATALNIERHAVALALEYGPEEITVEKICEASGVSQRTFFNYFGAKDIAILGRFVPEIDETLAREFLVSSNPDILGEILRIVRVPESFTDHFDIELNRFRVLEKSPHLMAKQMERFSAVAKQVEEILYLRLLRDAPLGESEQETRLIASLASELVAVTFRFNMLHGGTLGATLPGPSHPEDAAKMLKMVFSRIQS